MLSRSEDAHLGKGKVDTADLGDLLIGVPFYVSKNECLAQRHGQLGHRKVKMLSEKNVSLRCAASTMEVFIERLVLATPCSKEIQTHTTSDGKEPRLDVGRSQIAMVLIHANERLLKGVARHRFIACQMSAESVDRPFIVVIQSPKSRSISLLERRNDNRKVVFADAG